VRSAVLLGSAILAGLAIASPSISCREDGRGGGGVGGGGGLVEEACPEPLIPGRCGLTGQCVECNRWDDCIYDLACDVNGTCNPDLRRRPQADPPTGGHEIHSGVMPSLVAG
jgi:hypothetical protein